MAITGCKIELNKHISCVKDALRYAVEHKSPYAPGTGPKLDKCHDSRHEYVECVHGFQRGDKSKDDIPRTRSLDRPDPEMAQMERVPSYSQVLPTCSSELNLHAACVRAYLQDAVVNNKPYLFLNQDLPARDRCLYTRAGFTACMYPQGDPLRIDENENKASMTKERGVSKFWRSYSVEKKLGLSGGLRGDFN